MIGKFINHCEDSLTASVISHLLHLPIELFWKLLTEATIGNELPEACGEPEAVDFWPKWNPTDTTNSSYVEPDVFLRFKNFDLIVEAKRWDGEMQYENQWKNEFQSYLNVYEDENKPVMILALGGIGKLSADYISVGNREKGCSVLKCTWNSLLHKCKELQRDLAEARFYQSGLSAQQRIIDDIIDLFAWHGFSTGKWAADFDFNRNRLRDYGSSIEIFRTVRSVFRDEK